MEKPVKRSVVVRTSFVGFHRYKNGPEEFLRTYHRHVFFVETWWAEDESRQVEFINAKAKLDIFLNSTFCLLAFCVP